MRRVGITFHDVVARSKRAASGFQGPGPDRYKVSPEWFEAQLEALAQADVTPDGRVVLTFDDGGASALTTTAPLLERHAWRGWFFVVADRVGLPAFLDADACRSLAVAGHRVGSHGLTHRPLTLLSDAEVAREWRESRELLEDVLGAPVASASVPRGYYAARIGRLAAAAGYRELFTSEPWLRPRRIGELAVYGRFAVTEETSPERAAALASLSPRAVIPTAAGWQARKAAKRLLGPAYETLRSRRLARG